LLDESERGVYKTWRGYECMRCGNKQQTYFASFRDMYEEQMLTYCRKCITIGQANTREALCAVSVRKEVIGNFSFALPFALQREQQRALLDLQRRRKEGHTLLLQAVCGAGKTEIIAAFIADALRKGQYVGWAIARKDVVIEITERLRLYFPITNIVGLYQGSPDLTKDGQLIVLTTARLYDFYRFFDILIVDENDAFPFSIDEGQKYAAKKAVVPDGLTIHISATVLRQQRSDYDYMTSIARRFHQHDLPHITFQRYPLFAWWRGRALGKRMSAMIDEWLAQSFPIFIFVSNKKLGRAFTRLLQYQYGDESVMFVSSDMINRTEILKRVRAGSLPILVTTTILERGITYKNLQVIVLDADAMLFDAQTLIQIAGRVGRNIAAPTGSIVFCYETYVSHAMRKARRYHAKANEGKVVFL